MHFKLRLLTGVSMSVFIVQSAMAETEEIPSTLSSINVEGYLLDTLERTLPERQQVGAEFLDPVYDPTLQFTQDAQVSVTFLTEGAGYRNSLGYFAFQDGAFDNLAFGDIDLDGSGFIDARELQEVDGVTDVGIIFGNASGSGGFAGSGGNLSTGDTYVLGDGIYTDLGNGEWDMTDGTVFEAGTNLGFFVSANSWSGDEVNGWDNEQAVPTYYTTDFLNPENPDTATEDTVDDLSRHVAMLDVQGEGDLLLGFEDLNRNTGDNDFNDAVFLIRTTPTDAYDTSSLPQVSPAPSPGLGMVAWAALGFAAFRMRQSRRRK